MQKCVQHPDRVHAVPPHLRHGGGPALQRQILLLHRRVQVHGRRLPVGFSSLFLAFLAMSSLELSQNIPFFTSCENCNKLSEVTKGNTPGKNYGTS